VVEGLFPEGSEHLGGGSGTHQSQSLTDVALVGFGLAVVGTGDAGFRLFGEGRRVVEGVVVGGFEGLCAWVVRFSASP
jgi:hypothetical protein